MEHTWRKAEIACYALLSEKLLERGHNNLDLVRKILDTANVGLREKCLRVHAGCVWIRTESNGELL